MPRKDWTDLERKEFGAKMRRIREEKQQAKEAEVEMEAAVAAPEKPTPNPDPVQPEDKEPSIADLQKQILEMKELMVSGAYANLLSQSQADGPTISASGVRGTIEKYLVDPSHYPNPLERLARESRLQRFAFPLNYDMTWEISTTQYETKDGLNVKEPRFIVKLNRIGLDPDTGDDTGRRYRIATMMFHEDPQASLVIARDNGIEPMEFPGGDKAFLDEMRYFRVRDWLLEAFYPPKNDQEAESMTDAVIDGKIVQMFTVNSEDAQAVPFDKMRTTKL